MMYTLWSLAVLYIKEQRTLPFIGFGVGSDVIYDITHDIIGKKELGVFPSDKKKKLEAYTITNLLSTLWHMHICMNACSICVCRQTCMIMCVYVCMYIGTNAWVYMYVCMYVDKHKILCISQCIQRDGYVYMHRCVAVGGTTWIYVCLCTCTVTCILTECHSWQDFFQTRKT